MTTVWEKLVMALQKEEALFGGRITPMALFELVQSDQALLIEKEGEPIAFVALWPTQALTWRELGSVWVAPAYRGQGLWRKMLTVIMNKVHDDVFLVTHNPRVVRLVTRQGWHEADAHSWNSVPWEATCEPCDRWKSVEEKQCCTFRAVPTECRLFFLRKK